MFNFIYAKRSLVWLMCCFTSILSAQEGGTNLWQIANMASIPEGKRSTISTTNKVMELDVTAMRALLATAPMEPSQTALLKNGLVISLPMPDGSFQSFEVFYYHCMHPELAAKFPMIKTYTGRGITNKTATIKLDVTSFGFHAMIRSAEGDFFIDPYHAGTDDFYLIYNKKDLIPQSSFVCESVDQTIVDLDHGYSNLRVNGSQLRTYRLALACTGEYAAVFGGTTAGAASAMTTSMNRVNGVYESELSVRMQLISNNNLLIYLTAATDPYTNSSGSTMLTENQNNINTVIGSANYDIGHVFSTGGGGVAGLGVVCGSSKARGVTGRGNPTGDAFDIDYVAHEMGHQFAGSHTFNSVTSSCNGNRTSSAAYEPGSGITIQAYAGICGADNLAANSIAYFHVYSLDQMVPFITTGGGSGCPVVTATGNTPPTLNYTAIKCTIPASTPFVLTGSGNDLNGDALTYSWDQYDLGPAGAWNVQSTTAPQFRTFTPTTSTSRTFPKMSDVVNNTTTIGELLPNQTRLLKFRLTVRDNRAGGGGIFYRDTNDSVQVLNTGAPFAVTAPNTALTWAGNSTQTVTWDVAGTTANGINTANVLISLSTDGGFTYPTVLLASTANDGSESITVPNINTTTARIKVEAIGNIFFDISNTNFSITPSAAVLSNITTGVVSPTNFCAGANLNVTFTTNNPANAGNVFTVQLSNGSGSFAAPETLGTLTATTAGTIACTIPSTTPTGSGYRIRVVSSNPSVIGSDNGANINISAQVAAAGSINTAFTNFCGGLPITFTVGAISNATTYTWSVPAGAVISSGQGSQTVVIAFPASGVSGNVSVFGSNANCTGASSSIGVVANPVPAIPTANAASGCAGTPITLSGTPAGGSFSVANPYNGASTTFTYTVMNGFGCMATSAPASITVNNQPSVNASNASGCAGTPINLSGTPSGGTFNVSNPYNGPSTSFVYSYTDLNGCSNSASANIVVNPLPVVTVNTTPASCGSSNGTAIASITSGTAPYNYSWSNSATTASITGLAPNTYSVIVTDANNCIGTNSGTVSNSGGATATFTASATSVCAGQTVTLTNTTAGSGLTFQWRRNNLNVSGATNATYTFAPSGTASYALQVSGSCGTATSTPTNITANGLPTTAQATATTNSSTTICSGSSIVISVPATAGYTYQWQRNSVNIVGATNNSLSVNATGSYRVFVYNSFNCARVSNVIATSVVSNIVATIAATGPTTICTGSSVVLTASPSGSGYLYQWNVGGSPIAGATNQTYAASTSGNYTCTVSISTCTNTSSAITVNVGSGLIPPINLTYANICGGNPVALNTNNYGVGYTYQWRQGGSIIVGATNFSYSTAIAGNYTVDVSNGACSGTSAVAQLVIGTAPSASFTSSHTSVCAGVAVTMSASPTGLGYTYQWRRGGANLAGATNAVYSFAAGSSFDYTVVVSNNCGSSTATPVNLTVNPIPTASIAAGGSTSICAGNTVTLTATSNIAGSSFQWQRNSANIVGATNATYAAGTAGAYRCIVTSPSNCTRVTNSISVVVNCRLAATSFINGVYPNPANNQVTLQWETDHDQRYAIQLMSITGAIIKDLKVNAQTGANQSQIDLTDVNTGIYLLAITNQAGAREVRRLEVIK
ncbi:MAG: hypothetical protein RIQ89_1355 [Bacteroidota bacterium]